MKAAANILKRDYEAETEAEAPAFSFEDLRKGGVSNASPPSFNARDRQLHLEQAVFNAMFRKNDQPKAPSFNARQLLIVIGTTVACWAVIFAGGALLQT